MTTDTLSKSYGDTKAVNGVSIAVTRGSLFGLLGPNGSGKTPMIRMLTGHVRPTGGSARVLGLDPAAEPVAVREHVGIIPEQESPPRKRFSSPGKISGRIIAVNNNIISTP